MKSKILYNGNVIWVESASVSCLALSNSLWPPRTAARHVPLSIKYSRQEYCGR